MKVVIKFVTGFVTVLSVVVFSMSSADCVQYEPEEETDKFRNAVSTPHFCGLGCATLDEAPSHIMDLNNLSKEFPDFQVINNHLLCKGCNKQSSEFLQDILQGYTLNTLPSVHKDELSDCWYADRRCKDYVIYTLVIERHPDKAIAINDLQTKGLWSFSSMARLEEVENPEEAHVVIYSGDKHFGIYRGKGIVESKWGYARAIFRHNLWQIPKFYGNQVKFYKVIFLNLKDLSTNSL